MQIGDIIQSKALVATSGLSLSLQDFRGKWLVIYFYPKDATSGCTLEGQNFRDKFADFERLNACVVGVSRDSEKSHKSFKAKQAFPFELISDADEVLCEQFQVMKLKSMYGKQYRGIERSTFLIDPTGVLRYEWRNVKVKGHVDEVHQKLAQLVSKH
jgi:peroxiredoxin Q/BCP